MRLVKAVLFDLDGTLVDSLFSVSVPLWALPSNPSRDAICSIVFSRHGVSRAAGTWLSIPG